MPEKDEMFKQVGWMTPADQEILQVLSSGLWLSTGNIAKNTGYTSSWVRNRCSEMAERRVLEVDSDGDPFYKLTPIGERIVERDISARELERLTVVLRDYELINEE